MTAAVPTTDLLECTLPVCFKGRLSRMDDGEEEDGREEDEEDEGA